MTASDDTLRAGDESAFYDDLAIPSFARDGSRDGGRDEDRVQVGTEPTADSASVAVAADTPDPAPTPASNTPPKAKVGCLAFRGVGGGAGVTSLAIATAHQMSRHANSNVCLVDLDFSLGMCAHYLDIGDSPTVEDFRTDPNRVDRSFMRALVSHHDSGIAVLGAPGVGGANDRVNPQTVLRMLDVLSEMYSTLVLDVPRISRPWTEAALLAADRVYLVTELTIPSLHVARQRISEMEAMGVEDAAIVLNRYERRSFRASIRQSDAERALGRPVATTIANDYQACTEAINCGEPVGRISPDGRFSKDVLGLVRGIAPAFVERRRRPR